MIKQQESPSLFDGFFEQIEPPLYLVDPNQHRRIFGIDLLQNNTLVLHLDNNVCKIVFYNGWQNKDRQLVLSTLKEELHILRSTPIEQVFKKAN